MKQKQNTNFLTSYLSQNKFPTTNIHKFIQKTQFKLEYLIKKNLY